MYTPCVALNTVAHIPYWASYLLMTALGILFTIFGNLKSAITADVIQGLVYLTLHSITWSILIDDLFAIELMKSFHFHAVSQWSSYRLGWLLKVLTMLVALRKPSQSIVNTVDWTFSHSAVTLQLESIRYQPGWANCLSHWVFWDVNRIMCNVIWAWNRKKTSIGECCLHCKCCFKWLCTGVR